MTILPTQYRLAEITEVLHVASLLHDDGLALRRGVPAAPRIFPPNLCVFCGHFLAAIASLLVVQLRNPEVISLDGTKRPERQWIWRCDDR